MRRIFFVFLILSALLYLSILPSQIQVQACTQDSDCITQGANYCCGDAICNLITYGSCNIAEDYCNFSNQYQTTHVGSCGGNGCSNGVCNPPPVTCGGVPIGSACSTCNAQTCSDGSVCAAGHTYCQANGQCGGCSVEVNNCATQCTVQNPAPPPAGGPPPPPPPGGPPPPPPPGGPPPPPPPPSGSCSSVQGACDICICNTKGYGNLVTPMNSFSSCLNNSATYCVDLWCDSTDKQGCTNIETGACSAYCSPRVSGPSCLNSVPDNGSDISISWYHNQYTYMDASPDNAFSNQRWKDVTNLLSTNAYGVNSGGGVGLNFTYWPGQTWHFRVRNSYGYSPNNAPSSTITIPNTCYSAPTAPIFTRAPQCFPNGGYNGFDITINWTNQSNPVQVVDVSTDPNFGCFWNKGVSGTSTDGTGFNAAQCESSPLGWSPNNTYYVRTWDGQNHSPTYSFGPQPMCKPGNPSTPTLSASCNGTTPTNNLSWTNGAGTSYVQVFRNPPNNSVYQSSSVATSYVDSSLNPNTWYSYWIQDCNAGGCTAGNSDSLLAKSCISPWIQTTGGDVHSNENISTPGGP